MHTLVVKLVNSYRVIERQACEVIQICRNSYCYKSTSDEQVSLRMRINEIAKVRVRYRYKRIHVLLRREGWVVNHKQVYRIYCEEGLNLRANKPKRRRVLHKVFKDRW